MAIIEVKYDQKREEKYEILNKDIIFTLSKNLKYVVAMIMYYNE